MRSELEITVIYDGLCEFCEHSLAWIQQRLEVNALAFQSADLRPFNLSIEQCAKQVFVVADGKVLGGADAIAYLLNRRGNTLLSRAIYLSGPLGRAAYRWVASHRNSWLIRTATTILKHLNT